MIIDKNIKQIKKVVKDANLGFYWEHIIASFVLSLGIPAIFWDILKKLGSRESHSQMLTGDIIWRGQTKLQDYLLLLSILGIFFLVYCLIYLLSCLIISNNGHQAEKEFRVVIALSSIPVWLWISSLLMQPSFDFSLLFLATLTTTFSLLFSIIAIIKKIQFSQEKNFIDSVGTTVLSILGSAIASVSIPLALGRIRLDWQLQNTQFILALSITVLFLTLIIALGIWLSHSIAINNLLKKVMLLAVVAQVFMPLSFLILIPNPWQINGLKFFGYPTNLALIVLITSLIFISYLDLSRRLKLNIKLSQPSMKSILSPWCLIGLLLLMKLPTIPVSSINIDDFHTGEYLLPWWLWKNFAYIPFHDYTPVRGLINYVPGLLADIFSDGTAPAYIGVIGVTKLLFLAVGFWVVSRSLGLMPTFLAFLLVPIQISQNSVTEIDIAMTVALCLFCEFFLKLRPTMWLVFWVILGIILLLIAPGQAGLLLLSTVPLALFALVQGIRQERSKLLIYCSYGFFVAIAIALFTPLDQMLFGAINYVREQSSINSSVFGISWARSLEDKTDVNFIVYQAIRSLFIGVGMTAGLLILRTLFQGNWTEKKRLLVFAIPIAILIVIYIPRAAGRIDLSGMTRLGVVSIWSVSLLLPLLLLAAYDYLKNPLVLLISAFLGGFLAPSFGFPTVEEILKKPTIVSYLYNESFLDGSNLGMPKLGKTLIDKNQLQRLQAIDRVLTSVLNTGETYLDLTNHNAHYFYLEYPPPIEVGAYYNLVHDKQQIRALQELKHNQPPLVLVSADNILFEGSKPSFRAYLLYRYLLENYTPVQIDNFIYMIKPERLGRLQNLGVSSAPISQREQLSWLDTAFYNSDLQALPISWGRSWSKLKSQLLLVETITPNIQPSLNNLEKASGSQPSLSFAIDSLKISGRDAGILAFDFVCGQKNQQAIFKLFWNGRFGSFQEEGFMRFQAKDGKILIPLDTAPRWLLADQINYIRFELVNPAACPTFFISNINLLQRAIITSEINLGK